MKLTHDHGGASLASEKPAPSSMPELVVHVSGAVKKPGVYHFKAGQRFYEAIDKAGGFRADADKEALNLAEPLKDADRLNIPVIFVKQSVPERSAPQVAKATTKRAMQSSRRKTGMMLPPAPVMVIARPVSGRVIGVEEESSEPEDKELTAAAMRLRWGGSVPEPKAGRSRAADSESVNINTADEVELESLPGVGPATAGRIKKYRDENGEFGAPEDLMGVKGIGQKTFSKLKTRVTI